MERVLAAFVRALRAAGSPVSTAETIDAVRAVSVVGYGDRQILKDSLGAVLAKRVRACTSGCLDLCDLGASAVNQNHH